MKSSNRHGIISQSTFDLLLDELKNNPPTKLSDDEKLKLCNTCMKRGWYSNACIECGIEGNRKVYVDEEADINEEVEDEYSDDEFFGVDMGYDLPDLPTDHHLYCSCPLPDRREASKRPWITNADGSTEYYEFCDECKKEIKE